MSAVTFEQLKEAVEKTKNEIDDTVLYFELKKRKLIRGSQGLENVKTVIAMVKLHMPITAYSLKWAKNSCSSEAALTVLHQLGDKKLLIWRRTDNAERGSGNPYEWIPSPYLADLMAYVWRRK